MSSAQTFKEEEFYSLKNCTCNDYKEAAKLQSIIVIQFDTFESVVNNQIFRLKQDLK